LLAPRLRLGCNRNAFNEKFPRFVVSQSRLGRRRWNGFRAVSTLRSAEESVEFRPRMCVNNSSGHCCPSSSLSLSSRPFAWLSTARSRILVRELCERGGRMKTQGDGGKMGLMGAVQTVKSPPWTVLVYLRSRKLFARLDSSKPFAAFLPENTAKASSTLVCVPCEVSAALARSHYPFMHHLLL
jgi:hypothetical protein